MSIGNYLTALDEQRDALARNLVTMGVQASESEKLNTLVPKVLQIPLGWLGSVGNYINVLHECSGINDGEYYLAWKAVTDNTSPMIRSVKVVDVTI